MSPASKVLSREEKARAAFAAAMHSHLRAETSANEYFVTHLQPLQLTVPCDAYQRAFMGGDLLRAAILQSLSGAGTTLPGGWMVIPAPNHISFEAETTVLPPPQGSAGLLLAKLKGTSALTYEELAPLLGVSRRTLHTWNAGGPISARREARVRRVVEAVAAIAAVSRRPMRAQLLDRQPNDLRLYDLLAEGLFQEAVDAAAGTHAHRPGPKRAEWESLATQLDRRDDDVSVPGGRVRKGLSRRIR